VSDCVLLFNHDWIGSNCILYVVIITVPSPSSSHNDITTHLGTKSDTDQRLPIKQMTNTKHKTQKKTEFINTKQIQNTKKLKVKIDNTTITTRK
jgi:hypothetical protein